MKKEYTKPETDLLTLRQHILEVPGSVPKVTDETIDDEEEELVKRNGGWAWYW